MYSVNWAPVDVMPTSGLHGHCDTQMCIKAKQPFKWFFNDSAHLITMKLELKVFFGIVRSIPAHSLSFRQSWSNHACTFSFINAWHTQSLIVHDTWLSWKWLSYWFGIYQTALCVSGVQAFLITGLSSYCTRLGCITHPRLHQRPCGASTTVIGHSGGLC